MEKLVLSAADQELLKELSDVTDLYMGPIAAARIAEIQAFIEALEDGQLPKGETAESISQVLRTYLKELNGEI